MQRGWWLEDVRPGTIVRHPGGRTITADEHPVLAALADSMSEVHGNADRAARTPFGQPLVLGALTTAVVIGLAAPAVGRWGHARRALPRGWRRIRLSGVVLAGDTLRAESRIVSVARDADGAGGLVERSIVGRNQRHEGVVEIDEVCWVPDGRWRAEGARPG